MYFLLGRYLQRIALYCSVYMLTMCCQVVSQSDCIILYSHSTIFSTVIIHVTVIIYLLVSYFFYWRIRTHYLEVERQMTKVFKLEILKLGLLWKNGKHAHPLQFTRVRFSVVAKHVCWERSCYKHFYISNGPPKNLIPL